MKHNISLSFVAGLLSVGMFAIGINPNKDMANKAEGYVKSSQPTQVSFVKENATDLEQLLNRTFNLTISQGKTVAVTFTTGQTFDDILIVKGRTQNNTFLNTTMTIGDGGYLMTIDDYENGTTYRFAGKIANGNGIITSINNKTLEAGQIQGHTHS